MPASCASASPPASARLEITSTISAGYSGARAAAISAARLLPRPEITTATFRLVMDASSRRKAPAREILDDTARRIGRRARHHGADARYRLTGRREHACRLVGAFGRDDHDHA